MSRDFYSGSRPGVMVQAIDGSVHLSRFWVGDHATIYYACAQNLQARGIYLSVEYLQSTDEGALERLRQRQKNAP